MRFLIFLLMPLAEIAGFVWVGSHIGVLATLGLVVASAVLGAALMRFQGFGVLRSLRLATEEGRTPGRELAHGVMILLAGILLIIPGFVSDIFGLLLFIPFVRERVWSALQGRIVVMTSTGARGFGGRKSGRTIDLDADDFSRAPRDDSPWKGIDDRQ